MNTIVELSNDCSNRWVPETSLCEAWIEEAINTLEQQKTLQISLKFVEVSVSAELNMQYRGKQSATNVLSFPAEFPVSMSEHMDFLPLGDIVICPEIVEQEAHHQHKELQAHWAHILIHGLLHLSGFDHESEEDASTMEGLEIKALERLGFPNPYLIG
ncbi:MAG: rRNA maturation RNase YbeY [SAR86 cluster bacterium]|uniref:Endoribonuclease YbeY n=1 Tax=SAR86 cluster bacterium TaxID=2030880 RepID=A0A2A5AEG3_9GAMM|nr:MAG: rRNA maturation RNase YbeY [SAR86 cluster bacterium]